MIDELKIIAATLVLAGVVAGFINLKYAPHALLLQSSPNRPRWLSWLAWGLPSFSALAYVALDYQTLGNAGSSMPSAFAVLYWAVATILSLFYGLRACQVFEVDAKGRRWEWHVHQFWFNLLGSVIGWALAWPLVRDAVPCIARDCAFSPTGWNAAALFVAFVGMTGHLPKSVIGVISGLQELFVKLLDLAKK